MRSPAGPRAAQPLRSSPSKAVFRPPGIPAEFGHCPKMDTPSPSPPWSPALGDDFWASEPGRIRANCPKMDTYILFGDLV